MENLAKPGDEIGGRTIETILGQSPKVLVFTTNNRELRWSYSANGGHVPADMLPAISTFDALMTEISTTVEPDRRPVAFAQLGKALFNALDSGSAASIGPSFQSVHKFVTTCALHAARFKYVVAFLLAATSLSTALLLLAKLVPAPAITMTLVDAAAAGIGGAAMSVLYRSGSIALDPTAHSRFLILQGVSRCLLGALFGAFIVLACQGELLFAFAKDHPLALYPLATIAGYSERFVPEVMSRLESTT